MREQRYHDGNQRQLRRLLSLLPSSSKEHASLIASKVVSLLTDEDLIKKTVITAGCGMSHSSWDVRFALSSCLEEASRRCLLSQVPSVSGKTVSLKALEMAWLKLADIDIQAVLGSGTLLLSRAPSGLLAEVIEASNMNLRLEKQKQQLRQCIGLETSETGVATYYGGVAAILTDNDIKVPLPTLSKKEKEKEKASSMSSRLRNRKRRREAAERLPYCKRGYVYHGDTVAGAEGSPAFNSALQDMGGLAAVLQDKADNGGLLPCFESNATALDILLLVANDLAFALFHQNWEARHGAALGLASIVRGFGGCIPDLRWAEDLVSRCICVLELDRFGDYSLSSMIAPVRETVAQLIGLTARSLSSDGVSATAVKLASLTSCPQWEVRHGGFVGLQALAALEFGSLGTAATKGVPPKNVKKCHHQPSRQVWQIGFEAALEGLADTIDDVCGGAARLLRWILAWVPPPSPSELNDNDEELDSSSSINCEIVFRKASQAAWKALDGIQNGGYVASCTSDLLQLLEACGERAIPPLDDEHGNDLKGLLPLWYHPSDSVRCSTGHIVLSNVMNLLGDGDGRKNSAIILFRCIWGLQHDPCRESMEMCGKIASRLGELLSSPPSTLRLHDTSLCCSIDSVLRLAFLPLGSNIDNEIGSFPFLNASSFSYPFLSTPALPVTFHRRMETFRVIMNMFGSENVAKHALDIISRSENDSVLELRTACQMETAYLLLLECLSAGRTKTADMTMAEVLIAKQLAGSAGNGLEYDEELSVLRKTFEIANQEALRELLRDDAVMNNTVNDIGNKRSLYNDAKMERGEEGPLTWEAKAEAVKTRISELENLWWRRINCVAVKCALFTLHGKEPTSNYNSMIRPLMETLKTDPCHDRKEFAAETLSLMVEKLLLLHPERRSMSSPPCRATIVCHKILNNLSCYMCSSDASQKWGGEVALAFILGSSSSCCPAGPEETEDAHNNPIQCWLRDRLKVIEQICGQKGKGEISTAITASKTISLGIANVILGRGGCNKLAKKDKQQQQQLLRFQRQQLRIIDETPLLQSLLRLSKWDYKEKRLHLATLALNAFLKASEAHPERAWTALQAEQPLLNTSDPVIARWDAVIFSLSLEAMTKNNNQVTGTVVMEAMPIILRGVTDSDDVVRQSLSGVFSTMVTLLSTVNVPPPPVNKKDGRPSSASLSSPSLCHLPSMAKQLDGQRSNWDSGILIANHLIHGHPLPTMGPSDLPDDLREAMRLNKKADGLVLRPYQWEGVAWLDFLRQIGVHGILADDMGLGKTLQSLLSIALSWCSNLCKNETGRQLCATTPSSQPDGGVSSHYRYCNTSAPPALVICPTTLVSHWINEAKLRFGDWLEVVPIIGNHESRHSAIKSIFSCSDVVSTDDSRDDGDDSKHQRLVIAVVSYSALKAELNLLSKQWWGSLVFDEAHLLRNPGTKLHYAARQLRSNHRIALTGTPIQNSPLELWSLFQFTMPGYLEDMSEFRSKYVTPIHVAFDSGSNDTQCALEGIASLDILHKKVLPFVLRREKGSVLSELPPKVIVDVFCDLTPYQVKLHNALTSTSAAKKFASLLASSESIDEQSIPKVTMRSGSSALRWLSAVKRLCVHPALALPENHPDRPRLLEDSQASNKLACLRQLLWDCGIGLSDYIKSDGGGGGTGCNDDEEVEIGKSDGGDAVAPSSHNSPSLCCGKVLVFAQCKATLDVVEMCLLKPQLPSVHFVRLDGNATPTQRDRAVTSFQEDPSVTLLLITTRVGGLGLNLTAASTIIFLEHDWNPMADLQAMDRAHRLGQRHCLMVYRIIARESIEERIMALQSLKVKAAETIIKTENSSLCSMSTDEVINLLNTTYPSENTSWSKNRDAADSGGAVDIFVSPDWESSDYAYLDLENFVAMYEAETKGSDARVTRC